jgi:hypothetical protein
MKASGFGLLASALAGLLATATPASADATLFFGTLASGGSKPIFGGAIGFFPPQTGSVVGFEVELARSTGAKTFLGGHRVETYGGALLSDSPAQTIEDLGFRHPQRATVGLALAF